MSMLSLVMTALKPTGVPVGYMTATAANTYITFFFVNERGSLFVDDDEIGTDYLLQVDIWSKGDYTALYDQVKSLLKGVGFIRTHAQDLYETDTKIYHKAITFSYTKRS